MSKVGAAHNVQVLGSGETTIVLGSSFGADKSVWMHLVPHLVGQYRVLLYDVMGAGATNTENFNFDRYSTIDGQADDLLAILDEFNVGKCIFIGHSMSAMAAVVVSVSRPDLFHKLILLSSTPRMSNTADYHGGFEQEQLDHIAHEMETNYEAVIAGMASMLFGDDMDSAAGQVYTQSLFKTRPDIVVSMGRVAHRLDVRAVLPLVTVPCHIIQSSKDTCVPVVVAEYLHKHLGGKSTVEVMPCEGHMPHLSSPEIAIPVLLKHIKQDIVADA
ncbi:Strigolactone receptor KAI2d5 [Castilleja foliolosa]|uniref:Strigolactone receptor KAI2d5 n=1 Tax=Castilleja foliolosa TaxID=1961234 RepID=A0ABD3CRE4_9LAMI